MNTRPSATVGDDEIRSLPSYSQRILPVAASRAYNSWPAPTNTIPSTTTGEVRCPPKKPDERLLSRLGVNAQRVLPFSMSSASNWPLLSDSERRKTKSPAIAGETNEPRTGNDQRSRP